MDSLAARKKRIAAISQPGPPVERKKRFPTQTDAFRLIFVQADSNRVFTFPKKRRDAVGDKFYGSSIASQHGRNNPVRRLEVRVRAGRSAYVCTRGVRAGGGCAGGYRLTWQLAVLQLVGVEVIQPRLF